MLYCCALKIIFIDFVGCCWGFFCCCFRSLSLVCFKWLTVHRANMTHLRLGMWEEIVDDGGVITHTTPTTATTTTTTKLIPPPPLVGWFPSVRTLHIGPKFIEGWELAEYKSPGRLALERVAMPKEVHQMVMDLLAVQPFERLEEVHFDCFYVDDVAPPILDVLSTRFSESLRVLTLNEHSVHRRQMPSMKLVESLAKFPSLRALHISWDKYCEHSFEYGTPQFLRELGIKVLDLCERIPCPEELAIPLPLRNKASPWEWDFSSFKQLTRLIFSERSSRSHILHDFLRDTLRSFEQIKTFISQMFADFVMLVVFFLGFFFFFFLFRLVVMSPVVTSTKCFNSIRKASTSWNQCRNPIAHQSQRQQATNRNCFVAPCIEFY
jgi:hypothetical protein